MTVSASINSRSLIYVYRASITVVHYPNDMNICMAIEAAMQEPGLLPVNHFGLYEIWVDTELQEISDTCIWG